MTTLQAIILGIIQGITEFLPISSSGHLVIFPYLFGWTIPEQQIFPFNVLVQIGTLVSVIIYFRDDLKQIAESIAKGIKKKDLFHETQSRVAVFVLAATVPAGLTGLVLKDQIEAAFMDPLVAGIALLITSGLLFSSEKIGKKTRGVSGLAWMDAIVMGLFQALSVFPGISRSGSTISGGLFRDLDRNTASHFAFLMAIPIMILAGIVSLIDLFQLPDLNQFLPVMLIAFVTAAFAGYVSIHWLLKYLKENALKPFAIYCLILGLGTVALTTIPQISPAISSNPSSNEDKYQITYASEVDWILPDINHCSENFLGSGYLIFESEIPASDDLPFVHIAYTLSDQPELSAFQTGTITLVPFANSGSPLSALTTSAFKNILSGEVETFAELSESCPDCDLTSIAEESEQSISVWMYGPGSELRKHILAALRLSTLSSEAALAPSPFTLASMLQLDENAMGFLPARFRHNALKEIDWLDENKEKFPRIPLLAQTAGEPDANQTAFIQCMAGRIEER